MTVAIEIAERRGDDTAVVRGRVPHGEVGPFIGAAFGQVLAAVGPGNVVGPPFCRMDMAGRSSTSRWGSRCLIRSSRAER